MLGDIPNIFPKGQTRKFVEASTGEVIYAVRDTAELYYQKDIQDNSQVVRVTDIRILNSLLVKEQP